MTNRTTAITEIKSKVSMQEWQQRILDCQNSGMSVKAWCQANGRLGKRLFLPTQFLRLMLRFPVRIFSVGFLPLVMCILSWNCSKYVMQKFERKIYHEKFLKTSSKFELTEINGYQNYLRLLHSNKTKSRSRELGLKLNLYFRYAWLFVLR